jgi:putative membrane protein
VPELPARAADASLHPDYRYTLANERTLLAWLRTGLALVAGGIAIATYAPDLGISWGSGAVAMALVIIGLGTALAGYRRWRANEEAIRDDRALPGSQVPGVMAAAVAVVAVVVAVLVGVEVMSR